MREFIPPFCLLLSLMLVIGGFIVMALEQPAPSIELHQARVQGDEAYRDALEAKLTRRQWQRRILIGSLFGMALVVAATGYLAMRPR